MNLTPHQLAELRLELSAEYARHSEQLEAILTKKPSTWMEIRKGVASDTAATRAYEATQDGIQEMALRLRMKSAEKKMSAARSMLEVLSAEARYQM